MIRSQHENRKPFAANSLKIPTRQHRCNKAPFILVFKPSASDLSLSYPTVFMLSTASRFRPFPGFPEGSRAFQRIISDAAPTASANAEWVESRSGLAKVLIRAGSRS
jgi:hypothetical protein